MKEYRFSLSEKAMLPLPIQKEPQVHIPETEEEFNEACNEAVRELPQNSYAAYNKWKEGILPVPDEHLKDFEDGKVYSENDFVIVEYSDKYENYFERPPQGNEACLAMPLSKEKDSEAVIQPSAIEQELKGAVNDIDKIRIRLAQGSSKDYLDIKLYELTNRIFRVMDLTQQREGSDYVASQVQSPPSLVSHSCTSSNSIEQDKN